MKNIRLGVNIDHVATVRQARRGIEPSPVEAALEAEAAGANSIVCHLREDRRHIQDRDVAELRRKIRTQLNLEMGLAPAIIRAALHLKPDQVTLVPERRQELTTEGGLDVFGQQARIRRAIKRFHEHGIAVSLFIDPDLRQVGASVRTGARIVEIHTGRFANAKHPRNELRKVAEAARAARYVGLEVAAGHGLTEQNVRPIAALPEVEELNIGHSIISRALFTGIGRAVRSMKELMRAARRR